MRVGLVTGEYPPAVGGVGDHTARLASELVATGTTVEILTSEGLTGDASSPVQVLPHVQAWDWRILWTIPRLARERRWDVLHIQYQPAMYRLHGAVNALPWPVRAAGRARPAVVTTFHDLRFPYLFPKAGPLRTAAVRALATGSDAVIAVADSDLRQLQAWRPGAPKETTRHVPLGNQLDAPLPPGFDPAARRTGLGVPQGAPLIGYFGLINQSKGVRELVEALALLPEAYLVMLGERHGGADPTNAEYLRDVEALIARRGLSERVRWTGHLPASDLCAWLRTVDVVALPFLDGATLRRTSLIAAWTQGAAVVTTQPAEHVPWAPPSASPGRFVPPGDVQTLADAIGDLLTNSGERRRLAEGGRSMAPRFSWPEVMRQTLAVYDAARRVSGA